MPGPEEVLKGDAHFACIRIAAVLKGDTHFACIRIAAGLDRTLLWLLVTPSMHHLHQVMDRRAANSNFGVLFSFRDGLFGTYIDKPPQSAADHPDAAYAYGIREYRDAGRLNLLLLTLMPFKSRSPEPVVTAPDSISESE